MQSGSPDDVSAAAERMGAAAAGRMEHTIERRGQGGGGKSGGGAMSRMTGGGGGRMSHWRDTAQHVGASLRDAWNQARASLEETRHQADDWRRAQKQGGGGSAGQQETSGSGTAENELSSGPAYMTGGTQPERPGRPPRD